jgi:hypothetical protein
VEYSRSGIFWNIQEKEYSGIFKKKNILEYSGKRIFWNIQEKNIRDSKIKFIESLFCNSENYINRGFSPIFGKYF